MGLFSKKKTYVASTCYNLAGDVEDRPDYLKTVVVGAAITGNGKDSLGDAIRDGYTKGPAISLRRYYRWAEDNYNGTIGLASTGMAAEPQISPSEVAPHISHAPGKTVIVQSVSVDPADHEIWAEQWLLVNLPAQFNADWTADYSETTGQVTITLPSTVTHSFTPTGFDKQATYINAAYNEVTIGATAPTVTGTTTNMGGSDAFPSTSGWTTVSFDSIPQTDPSPWTETHGVYSKTETSEDGSGVVTSTHSVMYQDQTAIDARSWRIDTTDTTIVGYGPLRIFIYKVGSGITALDNSILDTSDEMSGFFAPIPVRINNQFLSPSYLSTQYYAAQAAYKKLMNRAKFDDLVAKLQDNPNLGDIDYAYIVPGVSLNVEDNSCKKYLYKFFSNAGQVAQYTETDFTPWQTNTAYNSVLNTAWTTWLAAQSNPSDPLNGTAEPTKGAYASAPINEVRIKTSAASLGYDVRISWKSIKEETGSGLGKVDAKVGEVWLSYGSETAEKGPIFGGSLGSLVDQVATNSDLIITWQTGASSWRRVIVRGLVHRNYVYGGKFVEIKVRDALDDIEESGFIIPIHFETWSSMSIKDKTQMTTACLILVLNSYQIVKVRWYQRGIFKIFLIIAAIVLTFFFPPAGMVGASLLTVTVYVVTNIIVSMILFKIISVVAVAVLGEKIGEVIALLASVVMMNPEAFFQNGAINLANLAHADNLLRLVDAIAGGISHITQVELGEIATKNQGILDEYTKAMQDISEKYSQNIGDGGTFDPMALTNASNPFRSVVEPSNVFLTRTLMTGSDIAELSMSLVSDFTSLTLKTELPV